MLIIVEGPSGSGKTYLIEQLKNELHSAYPPNLRQVEVWHKGPPKAHPLDEYETPLFDYRPDTGRHVICDRWHIGEIVYPLVYDRKTKMDDAVRRHIELFLRSRGAFLVHVTAPIEVLEDRLIERGRLADEKRPADAAILNTLSVVKDRFAEAVNHSYLPTMNVWSNLHGGIRPSYANLIVNEALEEERRASVLNDFTTYVGWPRPSVLIFGDVRNGEWKNGQAPAFGPFPGTSGHYLFSSLREHTLWNVGVANACDVDDPVALWKTLNEPRIVGLGRRAQDRLARLGLTGHHLYHPQYVRRFHHRRMKEYGKRFTEIVNETMERVR